jgi:hypothetical protein
MSRSCFLIRPHTRPRRRSINTCTVDVVRIRQPERERGRGTEESVLCVPAYFLNLMVLFNVHIVMKMMKRMIVQNDSIGGHRNIITGKYAGFFVPPPLPSYCYMFIGAEFVVRLF